MIEHSCVRVCDQPAQRNEQAQYSYESQLSHVSLCRFQSLVIWPRVEAIPRLRATVIYRGVNRRARYRTGLTQGQVNDRHRIMEKLQRG